MTSFREIEQIRTQTENLERMRKFCLGQFKWASQENKNSPCGGIIDADMALRAAQGYAACITAQQSLEKN